MEPSKLAVANWIRQSREADHAAAVYVKALPLVGKEVNIEWASYHEGKLVSGGMGGILQPIISARAGLSDDGLWLVTDTGYGVEAKRVTKVEEETGASAS